MRVGTKSVLFGAHCFFIHPWFVALGWWKLYGFPWDPRLWIAFFVHDLGYFGKLNMDGPEGERHPELGANLMFRLFGYHWYLFVLLHSRYYVKMYPAFMPSELCWADKLAMFLTPWWLYLPMACLTGEIQEYRSVKKHKDSTGIPDSVSNKEWVISAQTYMKGVAYNGAKGVSLTEEDHSLDQTKGRSGTPSQGNDSRGP